MMIYLAIVYVFPLLGTSVCEEVRIYGVPGVHEVIPLEEPICIPELKGRIVSESGAWSKYVTVTLILVDPSGDEPMREIYLDRVGRFHVPDAKKRIYCFAVAAPGWLAYKGVLIVDPNQAAEEMLHLTLRIG